MKRTWTKKVRPTTVDGDVARVELDDGTFALIDADMADVIAPWNWMAWKTGSGIIVRRNSNPGYVVMANLVNPPPPGEFNDHRDGNPRNNCRANLRFADSRKNARNMAKTGLNPFKGVNAHHGMFRARITLPTGRVSLGRFASAEQAGMAYDAAARKYFGEFCALNFPRDGERKA